MIKQISIFAENAKGAMQNMTKVLGDADINISSLITNDSAEFGIVRILVDDTEKAVRRLSEAGYLCHVDDVIAVEITDIKGSLNRLLQSLEACNINIHYLYVATSTEVGKAVAILRTPDIHEVHAFLESNGYKLQ